MTILAFITFDELDIVVEHGAMCSLSHYYDQEGFCYSIAELIKDVEIKENKN